MRQNNETKKASTSLKKSRKRYKNKTILTLTHKTRLKLLIRESKKSVFKARVKEYLTPKTPTHN
ncbi:hypothetical protein KVJ80_06910 [Helicobacter pylori]|nr:hypothetical protein KVJ80_06910 [Helicobacter pylori]